MKTAEIKKVNDIKDESHDIDNGEIELLETPRDQLSDQRLFLSFIGDDQKNANGNENINKEFDELDAIKTNNGEIDPINADQKQAVEDLLKYETTKKGSQAWGFFNNQVFQADSLVFDNKFYGDNWKTLLTKQMSQQSTEELEKLQRVEIVETYEPQQITLEISQKIEEERAAFIEKQEATQEDLSVFSIVNEKGFEKFQSLFGTNENEDGQLVNNFQRYIHPAFDIRNCDHHRNGIELFSYNRSYFIVTKSFSHKIGNNRLTMTIWKFEPSTVERRGQIHRLHRVEWPIVDKNACFDPNMISVIQWNQFLYYFKVVNQLSENNNKADIIFEMYRYDLHNEKESLVKEFQYNWFSNSENVEGQDVLSNQDILSGKDIDISANDNRSKLGSQVFKEKQKAYCAIFMKVDSAVCENEEEFVNRRMLALLFESGKGAADQTFCFKIRKLKNFQQDLFFGKQPINCNETFKFQYFMEESILKRQAFALIYQQKVMIVPVELTENSEVTTKEFYHYEGHECKCCNDTKRKIASQLKALYLENFKVLESYNLGWGEEYQLVNMHNKELAAEMIKYLEKDEQMKININRDAVQLVFDKRYHRYMFIFNVQEGESKDDIMIYESEKVKTVRNSFKYSPDKLNMLIKYVFHDREIFLEEQGIQNKDFCMQKQLFPLYNNVIAELKKDDENQTQLIVAYEQPKKDGKKQMHVSIDDAGMFMNIFHGMDHNQKIQFMQLAKDDRKILPRVVKDTERSQIMFQLYNFGDNTQAEEEEVEEEENMIANPEEEVEENSDEEAENEIRKKKLEERKRIIREIPLDLSTASLNVEKAQVYLQPSSSVYKQAFGQENNHYVQDFQVCVYSRGCQMIRIFQFRVYWNPKRNKSEPVPYDVTASLVGMKILIIGPTDTKELIGFFPMYNDYLEILGTQVIINKKIIIEMPNFERDDWLFATEIAMSGYKIYFNEEDLDEDCLLLQSNLAEVLNARLEFHEADSSMLLKYQIRFMMNMVPFRMDYFLMYELNFSNFLQPIELLDSQSCLDIMLPESAYLQNVLKRVTTEERQFQSLFEFFVKELDETERAALFEEDYYIPRMLEVSRDSVCSNPLLRCFDVEPIYYGSLEKIMAYMFSRPYAKNQSMIFMEVMSHMLNQPNPSNEFAKFFIDSPNAELNFNKIGSRFTVILNHPDLPQYSNKKITIIEFEDELSIASQMDVGKWMTDFIINNKDLRKNSQIPVKHYYVDFRIQNLGRKLNQFKNGEYIDTSVISDYEVSNQLYKICLIYGRDIEFQDGTRNIIDNMYDEIQYLYTIQFGLFLIGYALPLFFSVFVMEQPHYQLACNLVCVITMILFFFYALIELAYQRKGYFTQIGNINDIIIFITFAFYLGIRFNDARNYLPELISLVDDEDNAQAASEAEEGARRLAKGGSGGGAGKSSGEKGGPNLIDAFNFEGSFLSGFLDFSDRKIWKVALLGVLHTLLLGTATVKTILFLKIYDGFQELILVLQTCLSKVGPFSVLIYFWVLIIACMFRILGADNGNLDASNEQYKLYGAFFQYTLNTYRQSMGDPQEMGYKFWTDAQEEEQSAARIMSGMIWLTWLINQYVILIFSFNFLVSVISQSYEEALNKSLVVRYTFRCERVMEASIMTKVFQASRTLQTFSLSTNNGDLDKWPGFVQSIKSYVRKENIVLRRAVSESVMELNKKIDIKTDGLEVQINDLSKKVTNVSDNITEKLDFMQDKFNEIKEIIKANIEEGSEELNDFNQIVVDDIELSVLPTQINNYAENN